MAKDHHGFPHNDQPSCGSIPELHPLAQPRRPATLPKKIGELSEVFIAAYELIDVARKFGVTLKIEAAGDGINLSYATPEVNKGIRGSTASC